MFSLENRVALVIGAGRGVDANGEPAGRLGEPEDIAGLCVYLASEAAAWMKRPTTHLNGGNVTT